MAKRKLTLKVLDRESGNVIETYSLDINTEPSQFIILDINGFSHTLNYEGADNYTSYCTLIKSSCDSSTHPEK
jgi:hypothetical protein